MAQCGCCYNRAGGEVKIARRRAFPAPRGALQGRNWIPTTCVLPWHSSIAAVPTQARNRGDAETRFLCQTLAWSVRISDE
jgi:hypothetical protein